MSPGMLFFSRIAVGLVADEEMTEPDGRPDSRPRCTREAIPVRGRFPSRQRGAGRLVAGLSAGVLQPRIPLLSHVPYRVLKIVTLP
jgi:hypothetical protein